MDSPCRVSALQDAAEPGREDAHRRRQAQQPGGRPQAAREARLRIDAAAAASAAVSGGGSRRPRTRRTSGRRPGRSRAFFLPPPSHCPCALRS